MNNDTINLIFDCDGTLIDSYDAITESVCHLFTDFGISCDPREVRMLALLGSVRECIGKLSERYGLDFPSLSEAYGSVAENSDRITLMPHAEQVLSDSRFRCFVYTHRGSSCREILTRLGAAAYFAEIVDSTYGFRRKPDAEGVTYLLDKYGLDRDTTYYVGDRALDIRCGINAGIRTIFLKTPGVDIDCTAADFAVSDLGEITSLPL